jgi:3-deoxy-D-manno-octulosonic-acid transferase
MFWQLLYNTIFVPLGWIGFQLLGLVNRKARVGISGRAGLFERLERDVARLDKTSKRFWFHSSSLGEFEQAKPIIAEIKRRYPSTQIIVSFFSPSGYEHSRSYSLASVITYIPFDSRANAERFVETVRPSAAIMVRYDVWPNHLWSLKRRAIPVFIANATLRPSGLRDFPFVRQFHRAMYNALDYILTVSEDDRAVFGSYGLDHPVIDVMGDTRYDQVWRRSADSKTRHLLPPAVVEGKKILILGSSWTSDEDVVLPACYRLREQHPELLVILVPHEPTLENLERVEERIGTQMSVIRFSNLNDYRGESVILVDSVGILMALYRYAHVAYVGGSFGAGIHNVLEPAAYGLPVLMGPRHQNSQEAVRLLREGGAFTGYGTAELLAHLTRLFDNEPERAAAGATALGLVKKNVGATDRFLATMENVL